MGMGYIQEPEPVLTSPAPVPVEQKPEIIVPIAAATPLPEPTATEPAATAEAAPDPPEQIIESNSTAAETPATHLAPVKSHESNFEPLPLTDTSVPTATQAPATLSELSGVISVETFKNSGLIATCEHTIEPGNLKFSFKPRGHAPLRLTADDGRVAMFPRAWGKVVTADGREGWSWMEWNRNGVKS
jgi:hypothetical protein